MSRIKIQNCYQWLQVLVLLQNVIYMHFFLEMKLTEIAEAEGISLSLVKYRLKRGKELMKKALSEEE